jgi:hypothetical protein
MSFQPARLFLRSLLSGLRVVLLVGPLAACNRGDGAPGVGGLLSGSRCRLLFYNSKRFTHPAYA